MVIRELVVALGLDVNDAGFKKAEEKLGVVKKAAMGIGAALAGAGVYMALQSLVDSTTKTADEIGKMALSFGVTTDALQKLTYAADIHNVGAEQMRAALSRLSREAFDAGQGSDEAGRKFAQLGIQVRTSTGRLKPTEALFREVADSIKAIPDPAERSARAIALFGRDGARLVPLLSKGSGEVNRLGKELEDMGGVLSKDFIQDSDDFQDEITKLNAGLLGLKALVVHAIMPFFRYNLFSGAVAGLNKLLKGTEFLRVAFVVLGGAALTAGIYMLLPFLPAILMAALLAGAILGVIAVVEDLYMFFTGGESLIGRALAKIGITAATLTPIFDKLRQVASNLWDAISSRVTAFLSGPSPRLEAFFARLKPLAEAALTWINAQLDNMLAIDWGARIDAFGAAIGKMIDKVSAFINDPAVKAMVALVGGNIGKIAGAGLAMYALSGVGSAVGGGILGGLGGALPGGGMAGALLGSLGTMAGIAGVGYLGAKAGGAVAGSIFGSGESTMPAGGGGRSVVNAPQFNMEIEVNGAAGMDPNALAVEVGRQVDSRIQSHAQDLYTGLVPSLP